MQCVPDPAFRIQEIFTAENLKGSHKVQGTEIEFERARGGIACGLWNRFGLAHSERLTQCIQEAYPVNVANSFFTVGRVDIPHRARPELRRLWQTRQAQPELAGIEVNTPTGSQRL